MHLAASAAVPTYHTKIHFTKTVSPFYRRVEGGE